jgi:hypothetical protein
MSIRPSSLPFLAQCPCWESGTEHGEEYKDAGTRRHAALRAHCNGDDTLLSALDAEDREAVLWAAGYIRANVTAEFPVEWEQRLSFMTDDFEEYTGTADAVCGRDLFDLKWRERDYAAQMAAYALALFQARPELNKIRVHVLYGATQRADVYTLTEPAARELVQGVIAAAKDTAKQPTPCDYCGWCAHRLTCKPFLQTAQRVARGYADEERQALVASWHPSQMETPEDIALGITIARKILGPWCESMEYHAREAALKKGFALPGYELKTKRGRKFVKDVAGAHSALGLAPEQLLKCCDLRLNSSKSIKEKVGVIDVYAEAHQLPKAAAKRQVEKQLGDIIQTTKETVSLVAVGAGAEEETE